jgi:hypothetical protein
MAMFRPVDLADGFHVVWGNTRTPASGWLMYVQRQVGGANRMIGIYGGTAFTLEDYEFNDNDVITCFYIMDDDALTAKGIVNGHEVGTFAIGAGHIVSAEPTLIGDAAGIGGFPWEGEIYRCMHWDKALSVDECKDLTYTMPHPRRVFA